VLALTVIAPLLAATYLGCRTTAFYGLLALATAVLLGWYDQLYTEPMWLAQLVRLVGVAFGGVVAVVGCRARERREERIRRLVGEAAAAQLREIDAAHQAALAEGIQRGLLPDPPLVRRLDIAVRYVSAADDLQVGGDWYDVFPLADGRTAMVIGDVAGHDGNAAALMAQLRNLLRGIAQVLDGAAPAALVTALDLAVRRLRVSTLASMILAEITPQVSLSSSTGAEPEAWRLRWSNAGHPPPLLVCADRRIRLLETTPELLLGVDPTRPRTTHELTLQVGDAVVLFTDGLVERRGELIDDGLWRVQAAADAAGRSVDELCEALLSLVPEHPDDDVALLGFQGQPTTVAASEHDPSRLQAASG
jgi:phosphoserine phosphatase RsbU/P